MRVRRQRLTWLAAIVSAIAAALLLAGLLSPQSAIDLEFARLRWLAGAEERAVVVGDHRIVYVEAGTGTPVLLLHGYTGSKENWLPLMRQLRGHGRLIAPDLPGWGDSQRIAGADYGYAAQADRLAAFLRQIAAQDDSQPIAERGAQAEAGNSLSAPSAGSVLIGHSMGGGIATVLAAGHPALFSRLILMDASGVRYRDNAFGAAVLSGANPFAVSDRASLDRYLATVFVDPPLVPWPADRALIAQRIAQEPFESSVLDSIGRGPDAFLPQRLADRIEVPTLLLWCTDDRVIDVSASDIYRSLIRASTATRLAGCNHMPMMERPAETAAAIEEFLQ